MAVLNLIRSVAPRAEAGFRVAFTVAALLVAHTARAEQIMPYFAERAVYLEGGYAPLAWWANPALISPPGQPILLTANVSPVGDEYTVSSVRFAAPAGSRLTLGGGIAGAGPSQTGSYTVDNSGATYQSNFVFSRPSLQLSVSGAPPVVGRLGVLASFGVERLPVSYDESKNFFVLGLATGWVSPALLGMQMSLAAYWTGHFQYESYWDADVRAALLWSAPSEFVRVWVDYSRPFPRSLRVVDASVGYEYQVLKAMASVRLNRAFDLSAGVSSDFHTYDEHNGTLLHLCLELRPTEHLPFTGGYDIAVTPSRRLHLLHRVWLGYLFERPKKQNIDKQDTDVNTTVPGDATSP